MSQLLLTSRASLLAVALALAACALHAQRLTLTPVAEPTARPTPSAQDPLRSVFADYTVVRGSAAAILRQLASGRADVSFGGPTLTTAVEPMALRSADSRRDGAGVRRGATASKRAWSFRGAGVTTLTVAEDFVMGSFEAGGEAYFVEPARYLLPGVGRDEFLVYRIADVLADPERRCGVSAIADKSEAVRSLRELEGEVTASEASDRPCVTVRIAIASDFATLQAKGSVAEVEAFTQAIVAGMRNDYADDAFDAEIKLEIATQYVSNGPDDPLETALDTSTNASALVNDFEDWAEGGEGFGTRAYDHAQLWVQRDISGGVIGAADGFGKMCNGGGYAVMEDFSTAGWALSQLGTHELGHCFNLDHVPGDSSIMSNGSALIRTAEWSPISISVLNRALASGPCAEGPDALAGSPTPSIYLPGSVCLGEAYDLADRGIRAPTEWRWSATAGEIEQTSGPTTRYTPVEVGPASVTLTVNNANCAGLGVAQTRTADVLDEAPPLRNCTPDLVNEASYSEPTVGFRRIAMPGVENDGEQFSLNFPVYADHRCEFVASTEVDVLPLEIEYGPYSPLLRYVAVYIDLNADGDLSEDERVLYEGGIRISLPVYRDIDLSGYALPASRVLLRIIVDEYDEEEADNVDACSTPHVGQVEDYAISFDSPLPVELTSVQAVARGSDVEVAWEVAAERQVRGYRLEHGADGERWRAVASMPATGAARYTAVDPAPGVGTHYYRVIAIDDDGSEAASRAVAVAVDRGGDGLTLLAREGARLTLQVGSAGSVSPISVYSARGQLVRTADATRGAAVVLDLAGLPAGVYLAHARIAGRPHALRIVLP